MDENPLDLKRLMNQSVNKGFSQKLSIKTYKCDTCNTTYTDKTFFEMHKATHVKENTIFTSVKTSQQQQQTLPAVVQIVMAPGTQLHSQPALAHQTVQGQSSSTAHLPIIIQEQDLGNYKKTFAVEPQQIYTLAPMNQYQVLSATNNRALNVSASNDNQINLPSFATATPTYVVAATPDGSHHLQPLAEIIPQEGLNAHELQPGQILEVAAPSDAQNTSTGNTAILPHVTVTSSFSNSSSRRSRLVTSAKNRPYKCDQCTASFLEEAELEEHRKKHTSDGPFTCEDCHFTFMYKSHFRSHKTRCEKKKAMAAQAQVTVLTAATVSTTNSSTITTVRQFPTNQTNNKPEGLAPAPKYFAIPVSTAALPSLSKFAAGNSSGGTIIRSSTQPSHQQTAQPHQTRQLINSKQESPSKFNPNKPSFKRIKKEGRLDRPYECDECDASFQIAGDLSRHRNKHTGEGPFKCDDCKFVFLYRKLYDAHKRRCDRKKKETPASIQLATFNTSSSSQQHLETVPQYHTAIVATSDNSSNANATVDHSNNRIYATTSAVQQSSSTTGQQVHIATSVDGNRDNLDVSSMQLIPSSIIEMRPAPVTNSNVVQPNGNTQPAVSSIDGQTIIEQVIVAPTTLQEGGRPDYKYEVVPSPTMDGVSVNQIVNLIKTNKHATT